MCMHACMHVSSCLFVCHVHAGALEGQKRMTDPSGDKEAERKAEEPASVPTFLGESKECPSAWPLVAIPNCHIRLCLCGHTALHILMYKHPHMFIGNTEERNNVYSKGVFWGEKNQDYGCSFNFFSKCI